MNILITLRNNYEKCFNRKSRASRKYSEENLSTVSGSTGILYVARSATKKRGQICNGVKFIMLQVLPKRIPVSE